MSIYEKPTHVLMSELVTDLRLQKGQIVSRDQIRNWFAERYPKIKKGTIDAHLCWMTTNAPSRIHHLRAGHNPELFYQIDRNKFELYDPLRHPKPILSDDVQENGIDKGEFGDPAEARSEFAYERDLQSFLARNLGVIEPGLQLYEDEGITGLEYPAGGRFIDILAVDANNRLAVIELKVSRGYDRVVGQLLRYMAWVRQNVADDGQPVRGAIVARLISEDLRLACADQKDIALFEYQMSVTVARV